MDEAIFAAISSEACLSGLASRWAYRSVVAACLCPSNAPTIGSPMPALAPTDAKLWRRSWRRTSSIPAWRRTARHGLFKSARGSVLQISVFIRCYELTWKYKPAAARLSVQDVLSELVQDDGASACLAISARKRSPRSRSTSTHVRSRISRSRQPVKINILIASMAELENTVR